jgi:Rhodopirellula transposase DDE domain
MSASRPPEAALVRKIALVLPHLDERQRRLLLGAEASVLGRGGVRVVASASGVAERTIARGLREINSDGPVAQRDRVRKQGGGRKSMALVAPEITTELELLIDPLGQKGPFPLLKWTTKSTRALAEGLALRGRQVSHSQVAKLLKTMGYHLPPPRQPFTNATSNVIHGQFRRVNSRAIANLNDGVPVIAIWVAKRQASQPSDHDIYWYMDDIERSLDWTRTGNDDNTVRRAVQEIHRWWTDVGKRVHLGARELMITVGGASVDDSEIAVWRQEFAELKSALGIAVGICHLPPVAARWSTVRYRMVSDLVVSSPDQGNVAHRVTVESIDEKSACGFAADESQLHEAGGVAATWNYSLRYYGLTV